MLEFVARVFRGWMNVLLWLILIGCAIGGAILAGIVLGGRGFSGGYAFLGLIGGTLIGLITVILSGGLIANFLDMVDTIKIIESHIKTSSGEKSPETFLSSISPVGRFQENKRCKRCGKSVDSGYTGCPYCGASDFE